MSMVYVGYLGILLMLSLSVLGMPMAYAMCVVASMGLSLTLGPVNATTQSIFVMWEQASNFSLMSIPLFIFMGTIAFHSGIVGNLFIAFRRWIGFLPGGLAAAGVMAAGRLWRRDRFHCSGLGHYGLHRYSRTGKGRV